MCHQFKYLLILTNVKNEQLVLSDLNLDSYETRSVYSYYVKLNIFIKIN